MKVKPDTVVHVWKWWPAATDTVSATNSSSSTVSHHTDPGLGNGAISGLAINGAQQQAESESSTSETYTPTGVVSVTAPVYAALHGTHVAGTAERDVGAGGVSIKGPAPSGAPSTMFAGVVRRVYSLFSLSSDPARQPQQQDSTRPALSRRSLRDSTAVNGMTVTPSLVSVAGTSTSSASQYVAQPPPQQLQVQQEPQQQHVTLTAQAETSTAQSVQGSARSGAAHDAGCVLHKGCPATYLPNGDPSWYEELDKVTKQV